MAEEKKTAAAPKAKKTFKKYAPAAKMCQKCGARMADHKDRFACGRCGYTEFKVQKKA